MRSWAIGIHGEYSRANVLKTSTYKRTVECEDGEARYCPLWQGSLPETSLAIEGEKMGLSLYKSSPLLWLHVSGSLDTYRCPYSSMVPWSPATTGTR